MEKKLVPKLRFSEFSGEWEEKRLSNVCKINPRTTELPDRFIYIDLESVKNGFLRNDVEVISKNNAPSRAQRLLEPNDVLYQTVRPYQRNNYYFYADKELPSVASTGYAQLRCTKNNAKFLFQLLHTDKFVNDVMVRCTGTSYPAINSTDLASVYIKIPKEPEQTKISTFLSILDQKIELQQEKISNLEEHKKGMIQKIFNQEIIFKDENEEDYPEWEKKKLSQILKERKFYLEKDNGIPHGSLSKKGVTLKTERFDRDFLVRDSNKQYKVTHKGDICYNPANLKFGVICRNNLGTIIFSPIYVTFTVNKNFNDIFMGYYLTRPDFINRIRRYEEGTVYERMAVKPIDFLEHSDYFPTLKEQEKIAHFLSDIDVKIEKENEKLVYMKELKKGFMQKMFI